MDAGVTLVTDDQRLASPRCHDLHPEGPLGPSRLLQVTQVADVVYLNLFGSTAQLARVCQKALDKLGPCDVWLPHLVVEAALLLPYE